MANDLRRPVFSYGEPITQVRWTNTLARTTGLAKGTTNWNTDSIPLQRAGTNLIVVTASTTSWSVELGGSTTFNRSLAVQQAAPIHATIVRSETNLILEWIGGAPPFRLERRKVLGKGDWIEMLNNPVGPVMLPVKTESAFYRIVGQ